MPVFKKISFVQSNLSLSLADNFVINNMSAAPGPGRPEKRPATNKLVGEAEKKQRYSTLDRFVDTEIRTPVKEEDPDINVQSPMSSSSIIDLTTTNSLSDDSEEWPDVDSIFFGSPESKKPALGKGSQPKINKFVNSKAKQKDEELALTIDELLTIPDKSEDDELDELDRKIKLQKEKHRLQIKKLDEDAKIQQRRREDTEARYAANAINRNRLATELTQPVLKKMFANIRGFLEEIKAGLCKSTRHQAYHKSLKTRQALLYTMITHPFTDQQVDWAYKEFADIWLRTKQEHADNNEYVWKVLMPEGFIRLYSDFFQVTMKEAEQMIKETPFDDSDDDSSQEESGSGKDLI